MRENRFRGLGCGALEEPGKKKPSKHLWCAISRIREKETPWGIVTKFCSGYSGRNHVRNFWWWSVKGVASGRISRFPIDLRRRHYNTRTTVQVCDQAETNLNSRLNSQCSLTVKHILAECRPIYFNDIATNISLLYHLWRIGQLTCVTSFIK